MTSTLYVEGSLCQQTGVAGWGAVLTHVGGRREEAGLLPGPFGGATTMMELAAVEAAVWAFWRLTRAPGALTVAMRSTAALAVLRWVFPDAPFEGDVQPPKRLKREMREYEPLYELHDFITTRGVGLQLKLVDSTDAYTEIASGRARAAMETQRQPRRAHR